MFSREILVDGRGIGLNIFKCNFCHAHVVYQLKNELQSTGQIIIIQQEIAIV